MENQMKDFVVFSGNSNPVLAQKICKYLDVSLGRAKVKIQERLYYPIDLFASER
jgi:hypothetical protein